MLIKKVRAQRSQFSYTDVIITNILEVVTPLSIYHSCSTPKTFWEEKFTGEENSTLGDFTAVNMKNCGRLNVRKHIDIKDSDKYIIWGHLV